MRSLWMREQVPRRNSLYRAAPIPRSLCVETMSTTNLHHPWIHHISTKKLEIGVSFKFDEQLLDVNYEAQAVVNYDGM